MRPETSRYLRGTRRGEEPLTIHAAELHRQDEYIALCDGRAVTPLPDRFDPADPAACPLRTYRPCVYVPPSVDQLRVTFHLSGYSG